MEEKVKSDEGKLMIPAQTSDRPDYIQGIGKKEACVIAGAVLAAILLIVLALAAGGSVPICTFAAFFMIAATVIIIRRDKINESVIDKVRIMIAYRKMQKRYLYEHYDFLKKGSGEGQDE